MDTPASNFLMMIRSFGTGNVTGQNCISKFCNAMVVHGPLSLGGLRTSQERKAPSLSHEKSLQNRPRNATLNFGTLTIQKKNKHTSTLWGITSTQGSAAREFEKSAAIMEIEPMSLNNRCISPIRDDVLKWQSNSNLTRGKPKFSQKHASTPHGIQRQQQRNT